MLAASSGAGKAQSSPQTPLVVSRIPKLGEAPVHLLASALVSSSNHWQLFNHSVAVSQASDDKKLNFFCQEIKKYALVNFTSNIIK
jgi:hypothetical protein